MSLNETHRMRASSTRCTISRMQIALADAALLRHLRSNGVLGAQLAALRGLFLLAAPPAADFASGLFALLDAGAHRMWRTIICQHALCLFGAECAETIAQHACYCCGAAAGSSTCVVICGAALAAPAPTAAAAAGGESQAASARANNLLADSPAAAAARLQRLLATTLGSAGSSSHPVPPAGALTGVFDVQARHEINTKTGVCVLGHTTPGGAEVFKPLIESHIFLNCPERENSAEIDVKVCRVAAVHWDPAPAEARQGGAASDVAVLSRLRLDCRIGGAAAVLLTPGAVQQYSAILNALLQVANLQPLALLCHTGPAVLMGTSCVRLEGALKRGVCCREDSRRKVTEVQVMAELIMASVNPSPTVECLSLVLLLDYAFSTLLFTSVQLIETGAAGLQALQPM